jgi:GAF domain-containing protein
MDDKVPNGTDAAGAADWTPEEDLQSSLAGLSRLVSDSYSLEALLGKVATFAVHAVPGADGAGVTLLRVQEGRRTVEQLAASAEFVSVIDELQYVTLDEGPCITAALERRSVRSGSLGGEKLWPRFGPRVGRMGVHSVLSLPLMLPDQVVGAINVYAHAKDAFDDRAQLLGEQFAEPAAVAVHNAQVLARAQELAARLRAALATRPVVDQAIGLLRGRSGLSEDEALVRLRSMSQSEGVRLSDVATRLVDEATRRARALRDSPPGGAQE